MITPRKQTPVIKLQNLRIIMFLFFISTFIPLLKTLMTVVRIPCWIMFFHFTLQRLLAQGRGAARMSGRRSSLPSPCIYTVSNHCTYVNKKKNYLILFFRAEDELGCEDNTNNCTGFCQYPDGPGKKMGRSAWLQPSIQPEQFLLHNLVQLVYPILGMVKFRLVKPEVMIPLTDCVKV